jgi:PAS domain S-box-containing protein
MPLDHSGYFMLTRNIRLQHRFVPKAYHFLLLRPLNAQSPEKQFPTEAEGFRMQEQNMPVPLGGAPAEYFIPAKAASPFVEHKFRAIVEFTSDWIWEVDPDGRYTFSNKVVADILGYRPEEVLGRTPFDFMPPEEAERLTRIFGDLAAVRKPFSGLENINLHRSGRQVVLETSGVPIFDETGRFLGFRGIDRDVTARKELEEGLKKKIKRIALELTAQQSHLHQEITIRKHIHAELTQSENQFRSLVETLNEGIGIVDAEGCLTYVNTKFSEMLGCTHSEILGKKISDFTDDRNRRIIRKQLTMRQRGIERPYEIQFIAKDGGTITTVVSPRAMFDVDGRFQGSFAVITDISALKSAEQALRHREHQLREKTLRLQEMNTALEVLLCKHEHDKTIIQNRILANLKRLFLPHLDSLAETRLNERQRSLVEILKSNIGEVMSPFIERLAANTIDFTRTELEVAGLVRLGKNTQQIATALNISYKTAETHRWRIRKKLGLTHQKANLATALRRIQNPV